MERINHDLCNSLLRKHFFFIVSLLYGGAHFIKFVQVLILNLEHEIKDSVVVREIFEF